MKNKHLILRDQGMLARLIRPCGMVLLCLKTTSPATAQNAIAVQAPPPATPLAVQQYQDANPMQVFSPAETIPEATAAPQFLRWQNLTLHPHVDYQFLYGTGIPLAPGHQENTLIQIFSPGTLLNLGSHWTLDYTPALSFYSNQKFRNTVSHSVQLGWGTTYGNWFLKATQSYNASSDPLSETAIQTDQETYSTALNATYNFNDKISLDLELKQDFNQVGNGGSSTNYAPIAGDSRRWSTMEWVNYQFEPRLSVGLGAGVGTAQQDNSPDTLSERCQGRIQWRATDKLSLLVGGGLQDQQYMSGGASDWVTPVLDATLQYLPWQQTRLSLNANRSANQTYFQNQTSERTQIMGSLNQRLLGKLYLDLSGGYNRDHYVSMVSQPIAGRDDDYYSFNARLTCPWLKRGTVSIFYQYTDNASSQSGFTYESSQVGVQIGYRF